MVANVPNVLVVRSSLAVNERAGADRLAKAKPGKLNYGSVGNGSQPHLAAEMFRQMAGVKLRAHSLRAPRRRSPTSSRDRSISPSSTRRR